LLRKAFNYKIVKPVKVKAGMIDWKTFKKIKGRWMKVGIQVGKKLKVKVFVKEWFYMIVGYNSTLSTGKA